MDDELERLIRKRKKKQGGGLAVVIVAAIGIVTIAAVILATSRRDIASGGGVSVGGGEVAAEKVTADELYRSYHNDNVASVDAKYLNKSVRVVGRVLEIEQSAGGYVIGFETGPNIMINSRVLKAAVVAPVPAAERDAVGRMKFGDEVEIAGVCGGRESAAGRMGGFCVTLKAAKIIAHRPKK